MKEIIITEEDQEDYELFLKIKDFLEIKKPNEREFFRRLEPILYYLGYVMLISKGKVKFFYNTFEKPYAIFDVDGPEFFGDLLIFLFDSVYKETIYSKADRGPEILSILFFDDATNLKIVEHYLNIFDPEKPQPKVITK